MKSLFASDLGVQRWQLLRNDRFADGGSLLIAAPCLLLSRYLEIQA
jgi:hypothetical protein